MRLPLLLLISVMPVLGLAASVYRYTDEQGNVVYTDKPRPGAEPLEVPPVPAVRPLTGPPAQAETPAPAEPAFTGYKTLAIVEPKADEPIRANDGNITVALRIEPELGVKLGHKIRVYVDGHRLDPVFTSAQFVLENMDRGTHTLRAEIVEGETSLIRSEAVTFHVLRVSILFNNADKQGCYTIMTVPGSKQGFTCPK